MKPEPAWIFNEENLVGVDYGDSKVADEYENQHAFRNFREEADKMYSALQLSGDSSILDIGCGTGGLSIELANRCKHIYSVDVSTAMISVLKKKIHEKNISNITAQAAGFLKYKHAGDPLDAIVCNVALHHLPDFWKQIALLNFYKMLKDGGKLFLCDVVFGFTPQNYQEEIDGWLSKMKEVAGEKITDETIVHVRDEFSTWDWVLKGMLEKAGFNVIANNELMKNMQIYICVK
jgi:putative AdoMet-dependent methyltransferase